MATWATLPLAAAYLGVLFAVARFGERRAQAGRSIVGANVYALSLAVYCTSWTFFGSVGRAASSGLGFITIYLGPTLMLMGVPLLAKMLRISRLQHVTTIADFVAARYGKSHLLAGLATLFAVIGIVPYIALQLKAVAAALELLLAPVGGTSVGRADSTALIAFVLAWFAILFGTRHLDATERHEGLVAAIAFESVVKLFAFLAVGVFVTWGIHDGPAALFARAAEVPAAAHLLHADFGTSGNWAAMLLLSGFAVLFLPRQFQVMVVENVDEGHLRRAVWLFPLYLLAINLFVLPVALAGLVHFQGGAADPDTFVLSLPLAYGENALALLVFIGGLSAATGMIIVETVALSTMIGNDLVMPLLLRSVRLARLSGSGLSSLVLGIRRLAIVVVVFLGYLYFRLAGEAYALVSIGLISFSAVAQFAPVIIGGMYWQRANRQGAIAGLLAGFAVWIYTLLLPSFARSGWIGDGFVTQGLFGVSWLRAQALFGLAGLDSVTHCLFWSMVCNVGAYVWVSLSTQADASDLRQAAAFVNVDRLRGPSVSLPWRGRTSRHELLQLLTRFLGPERCRHQLDLYLRRRGVAAGDDLEVDADFVIFAEAQLAGVIGSASARLTVASVVEEEPLGLDEVLDILDEASQVRAYSRELEDKSRALEAASAELRAANERLRELDRLKDDFISTVSHELRTPLTSIRALSEMLHDDPRIDLADRERFLAIIVAESERLTRLINQILDLAKLESGRADWLIEDLELAPLVDQATESLGPLFRERGVEVVRELPAGALRVHADRDRLTQVFVNLLSNAAKFVAPGRGIVSVRVGRDGEFARIEVADNGPGVRVEEREKIFEKFRQGGDVLTGKPQGTGLGLPISRQIVEHCGGHLWVEEAEGKGAKFVFTLPLVSADK
jgi:Na+/proline symporter/nitrogen-specific signal transduction histidine kinase